MAIDREELEKKAIEAASAEEVMEIVRAAGEEITAEEAASFFKAVQERKADKELALDELEAVSGGQKWGNGVWVRDYSTEGCAATVEPGSNCWGTDGNCWIGNISYIPGPIDFKCPDCGAYCYESGPNHYVTCQACRKGYRLTDYITGPIIGT